MKHIIIFFLKPLSFLPALAMMCVIYGFSAQDGSASGNLSYQVSYKIVEIGNEILDKGLDKTQIADYADQIGYPVRKLAHMTEYFLLAVAVSLRRLCGGGRISSVLCRRTRPLGKGCGHRQHRCFFRDPDRPDHLLGLPGPGPLCQKAGGICLPEAGQAGRGTEAAGIHTPAGGSAAQTIAVLGTAKNSKRFLHNSLALTNENIRFPSAVFMLSYRKADVFISSSCWPSSPRHPHIFL